MKKRGFSLKREYKQCWKYLRESRKFIYGVVILFFWFSLIGFFVPASDALTQEILKFIEGLLEMTRGMSGFELTEFIFLNNVQSGLIGMIFGVLLGIIPILATIVNGYLLGFVANMSVAENGILSLWRILPHGIFELPAIFLSFGLGIKLGTFILQKKKIESFKDYFLNSLRVFFFVILPLLIVAAIIEGVLIHY